MATEFSSSRRRLTVKLIAVNLIVLFVPVLALISYREKYLPATAIDIAQQQLMDMAVLVTEVGPPTQSPEGYRVAFVSDDGEAFGDPLGRELLLSRLSDDSFPAGTKQLVETGDNEKIAAIARGDRGASFVAVGSSRFMPPLREHVRRTALVVEAALFLAVCLSAVISWALLKPLNRLRFKAQVIAQGGIPERSSPSDYGELGDVAKALDDVLDTIRERMRAIVEYSADTSHKIRTPLSTMRGSAEIIREGGLSDEDHRRFTGHLLTEINRMEGIVRDMLTLARLEAHDVTLKKTEVDVAMLIRESVDSVRFIDQDVDFRLNIPADPVHLEIDPERFDDALTALLENAVKYAGSRGVVTVTLEVTEEETVIRIGDSGPGIPDAQREQIFDRFFTTGRPLPDGTPATGLGLSISTAILSLHDGSIGVGKSPLGGAEFRIRIPI